MPNSLKCKIKHLCHNRTITESECDRILKALDQESVIDKIREEIETERNAGCHTQYAGGLDFALSIIDKYKAESEVSND